MRNRRFIILQICFILVFIGVVTACVLKRSEYNEYKEITKRAEMLLKDLFNTADIILISARWFDFDSDGEADECFARYMNSGGTAYFQTVLSVGYDEVKCIYNELRVEDFTEDVLIRKDNGTYLMIWEEAGSGHYLSVKILAYDGLGTAKNVLNVGSFFQGDLFRLPDGGCSSMVTAEMII